MGCNCGGARAKMAQQRTVKSREANEKPPRRTGGPGDPGYYWTGPKRPPKQQDA